MYTVLRHPRASQLYNIITSAKNPPDPAAACIADDSFVSI